MIGNSERDGGQPTRLLAAVLATAQETSDAAERLAVSTRRLKDALANLGLELAQQTQPPEADRLVKRAVAARYLGVSLATLDRRSVDGTLRQGTEFIHVSSGARRYDVAACRARLAAVGSMVTPMRRAARAEAETELDPDVEQCLRLGGLLRVGGAK
jgi:hypothetical protein